MSGHLNTETLSAYLDGELAVAETASLGAHLAACADCAARLEEMRATAAALRQLERPMPPAIVSERLRRQLAAERQRRLRPLWLDAWLPWRSLQPGLAAAALVFVTSLLVVVHLERTANRTADSSASQTRMRSLEEREQEAAAAPTVALPPEPRPAPAGRAESDLARPSGAEQRAASQPVMIESAETGAAAGNESIAGGAPPTREDAETFDELAAKSAGPPADAVATMAEAAPAPTPARQAARLAAPAAVAGSFSPAPEERTAAGRTFVRTGERWLEIDLALAAGPVEKLVRGEPLAEDLLVRWPDLRILLGDRVPVRMRHEGRVVELQP